MEVLLGITGRDYTIIAASKAAMRGLTVLKAQDDKTRQLTEHTVMATVGQAGDVLQFPEFIQANVALYASRNAYTLPPQNIAAFVRNQLAYAIRNGPYIVNLLIGGVDTTPPTTASQQSPASSSPSSGPAAVITPQTSSSSDSSPPTTSAAATVPQASSTTTATTKRAIPKLYWMDYLGSCAQVPYAAQGYAQYYCLSILDKHHHPDIDLDTGLKLLRMCSDELRRRLPIDFKGLFVKVVTADGVRAVDFEDDANIKPA